jgi:hypothetical protein
MMALGKRGRKGSSLKLTSGIRATTDSPLPDVMLKKFENRQSNKFRKKEISRRALTSPTTTQFM